MMQRLLTKLGIHTSNGYQVGYDSGYHKGLADGQEFGKRIAYNQVLAKEINNILVRYGQLQRKLLTKPRDEIEAALVQFNNEEIERFKMELQDR